MNNTHTIITKGFATATGKGERIWFVGGKFQSRYTDQESWYDAFDCLTNTLMTRLATNSMTPIPYNSEEFRILS